MASVTLFNTMDPYTSPSGTVEVPRIRLEVPVMCTYMRSMLMSADLGSMGYAPLAVMITQHTGISVFILLIAPEQLKQLTNMHRKISDK